MFKWPEPPDGQIIVRLPFKIYWAASLSVTLILGFGLYIWSVGEKPAHWPRTVSVMSWLAERKLFELGAEKMPADGSHDEKPNKDSSSKGKAKNNNDVALAAHALLTLAVSPNEATMVNNSQSAEAGTLSKSDIKTEVTEIEAADQNAIHVNLNVC
jgi:hypothetical protein